MAAATSEMVAHGIETVIEHITTQNQAFNERTDKMAGEIDALRAKVSEIAALIPVAGSHMVHLKQTSDTNAAAAANAVTQSGINPLIISQITDSLHTGILLPLTAAIAASADNPVAAPQPVIPAAPVAPVAAVPVAPAPVVPATPVPASVTVVAQ